MLVQHPSGVPRPSFDDTAFMCPVRRMEPGKKNGDLSPRKSNQETAFVGLQHRETVLGEGVHILIPRTAPEKDVVSLEPHLCTELSSDGP